MKLLIHIFLLFGMCSAILFYPQPIEQANLDKSAHQHLYFAKDMDWFKDGKGYFSYVKARNVDIPQGKTLIQFFFSYDCESCVNGLENLQRYAALHSDKIALQAAPFFNKDAEKRKNDVIISKLHRSFLEYGGDELAELYMFESIGRKYNHQLLENNQSVVQWLDRHKINQAKFSEIYTSKEIQEQLNQDLKLFYEYRPPFSPLAVVNGKYILTANVLNSDDNTFAMLDFLIDKIRIENKE